MSAAAELNLEILSHRKLAYFNIWFFPQIRTKNIIMKIPEKYESGDILTFLKLKLYLSADSSKQRCFNFFIFKIKLHFPSDTSPQRDWLEFKVLSSAAVLELELSVISMQASQVPLCIMLLDTLALHEAWPVQTEARLSSHRVMWDGGFETAFLSTLDKKAYQIKTWKSVSLVFQ